MPARSLGALALLCAATTLACKGDETVRIPLHLGEGAVCSERPMEPLFCDGTLCLELHVSDDQGDRVLRHRVPFAPQESGVAFLDALIAANPPSFGVLDRGTVSLRAAVFSPALVGACPDLPADPQTSARLPIAQGQSAPVVLDDDVTLDVELDCVIPAPFFCEEEAPPSAEVQTLSATVIELGTMVAHGEGLAALAGTGQAFVDLGFVSAATEPDGQVPPDMDRYEFYPLSPLAHGGGGIWTTEIFDGIFLPSECVGTLVTRQAERPIASCDAIFTGKDAFATGYTIAPATLTVLAGVLGHATVPASGLVVGRVVDASRQPVAGALVTSEQGGIVVRTPKADFSGFTDNGRTDTGGWFVIDAAGFEPSGARCCDVLHAEHPTSGQGGRVAIGLLENAVTATVIELANETARE